MSTAPDDFNFALAEAADAVDCARSIAKDMDLQEQIELKEMMAVLDAMWMNWGGAR